MTSSSESPDSDSQPPPAKLHGSCSICFEDLKQNDKISAIVCGHIYHHGCISQWIATKRQCPSCRRTVPKNGFVEKLFFDVQRIEGEHEKPPEIDYREEHYKLAASLKVEKENLSKLDTENQNLKKSVKSLEKKVLQEKDKYRKEVPKLQATINHLTISSEETEYLKRELTETKNKLKACEFYKLLTVHSDQADKQLGEYIGKNGNVATENFIRIMKKQNKDLTEKRKEAAQEIQQLQAENNTLKRAAQKDSAQKDATIKTLKDTVLELRERANVDTPISNKRLREVMETETPPPAKRISMGFDESSQLIGGNGELSFFNRPEKETQENKTPPAPVPSKPSTSRIAPFNFDDDDDDEYFRTPKITEKKKPVVVKKAAPVSEDSFDFDIPVPQSIINRIPSKTTVKPTQKPLEKSTKNPIGNVLKRHQSVEIQKKTFVPTQQKTARISSFFSRTTSATSSLIASTNYVTID